MRKLIVGLIAVSLLAVGPQAMAQTLPGGADPLSLIVSGAVLPYVGGGANASFVEVYAPLSGFDLHMFFFNPSCAREGDSANVSLTANDVEFLQLDNITPITSGLVAAASTSDGFHLAPLPFEQPFHARVLWVNVAQGYVRTLEPIGLRSRDAVFAGVDATWNPLRSGAAFWAPLEGAGGLNTVMYLICPTTNIISTAAQATTRAFSTQVGFPALIPAPRPGTSPTPLLFNVYDDEERFLRDITDVECECFSQIPVTSISNIYADAANAPFGTYSEVQGGRTGGTAAVCDFTQIEPLLNPPNPNPGNGCPLTPGPPNFPADTQFRQITAASPPGGPFSFTGYRSISGGPIDVFGRVSNAANCDVSGDFASCADNDR